MPDRTRTVRGADGRLVRFQDYESWKRERYKPAQMPPTRVLAGKMPPMRRMTAREQMKESVRETTRKMGRMLGTPPESVYTRGRGKKGR